ncbi:MAG TPA: ABC transporter permease [Terriglobales bacterium]|nr:ABC transporter permease [Terriglobales bacterium]
MRWSDAVTLALRGALRRPVRTALTTLGVTLGSGLLVALAVVTTAADTKVLDRLGQGNPLTTVRVAPAQPRPGQLDSDALQPGAPHDLTDAALASIRRAPHVTRVVPIQTSRVAELSDEGGLSQDWIIGTDMTQVSTLPITLLAGRWPAANSLTEVAATTDYLFKLHIDGDKPRQALGHQVTLTSPRIAAGDTGPGQGRSYRAVIVGVVGQDLTDGDFIVPVPQVVQSRQWEQGGAGSTQFPVNGSPYAGAVVVASSLSDVHTVRAELYGMGYATSAPEHLVASVQEYLGVVNVVLGSIGSVALGVALLSIANALLAAIHERRRDIGVLKAIGGRDRDVLRWFLVEALAIGLAGGAAGAVAGVVIAELVGVAVNQYLVAHDLGSLDLVGVPVVIPLLGWLGTGLLAVIAGGLPSLQAAHLPAREAVVEA